MKLKFFVQTQLALASICLYQKLHRRHKNKGKKKIDSKHALCSN